MEVPEQVQLYAEEVARVMKRTTLKKARMALVNSYNLAAVGTHAS